MSISASAVARVTGITTTYKNLRNGAVLFLPRRIAIFAQGATASTYPLTKRPITSAGEAGSIYGYGSPIHLIAMELFPVNNDGVGDITVTVYPLNDAGGATAAAGDITPSGTATETGTYYLRIGGVLSAPFTIAAGAIVVATVVAAMKTAADAVLATPMTTTDNGTDLGLTAKWAGASGNDLKLEVIGPDVGVSFAFTQPTGGATNPTITSALAQVGEVWETDILNGADIADTTTLDAFQTWGEGRWDKLVRKPAVVFTGNTIASRASAVAVSDARPTDRVNAQLVAPGSPNLPVVVAARQLARIAVRANNDPAYDYGSLKATGLIPGTDGEQWDSTDREVAVKAGSSTIQVKDGVINISDVVTFYKPTGEEPPAYRFVVDICKLQTTIFNIDLEFAGEEWDGKPLIPNDQPTINANARKPKHAIAAAGLIVDSLGDNAIISDPKTAKAGITASIDPANPKRMNLKIPVQVSGNTNIKDIELEWGFYFGSSAAA